MKTKSIIFSGLLLLGAGAATTSCEDMFTADNNYVTTDLAPQDTLYQMMGIINNLQKVADRSILFGELRADLVDINDHTPIDLREMAEHTMGESNAYNNPADFYSVINSCNIFLAHADSTLKTQGESYYEKEIIAAKCFRAWTYMELAKIYGDQAPFVTEPVVTSNAAEQIVSNTANRKDLVAICDFCINDLLPHIAASRGRVDEGLLPSYGGSLNGLSYSKFFIPLRLMLAELYLWRGSFTQNQSDYVEAIRYYHDYLAHPSRSRALGQTPTANWIGDQFNMIASNYANSFSATSAYANSNLITYVPMDTITLDNGNTSDIRKVFNSQYNNDYYPAVTPSKRIEEISNDQWFCFFLYRTSISTDTLYAYRDASMYPDFEERGRLLTGDLRLSSVWSERNVQRGTSYNTQHNDVRQYIQKYTDGNTLSMTDRRIDNITLYRLPIVYLHLAEALNRAGFPETAFAILKYGISGSVLGYDLQTGIDSTQTNRLVSIDEVSRLSKIVSSTGVASNAAAWDKDRFVTFDRWDLERRSISSRSSGTNYQYALHDLGSGDTWCNEHYYLPTDSSGIVPLPENTLDEYSTHEDSVAYQEAYDAAVKVNAEWLATDQVREKRMIEVDKMILAEEALEGMFEGTRYYDLMRYTMANLGKTVDGTVVTKDYFADAISRRGGKDVPDASLKAAINKSWYIPLRKR